jgi:hypothetical protein
VVRRAVTLLAVCGAGVAASACASLAGLGDYELAPVDASTTDASGEASTGDVRPGDAGSSGDDGDATSNAGDADAAGDVLAANDVADAGVPGDSAVSEAATDAGWDGPPVPPSDKGQVSCGGQSCALPMDECCEAPDGSTCQSAIATCGGGVIARCDEAADCLPGQVCCATSTSAYGLETECKPTCAAGEPQSCRTDAECGSAGTCDGWMCAGSVVATCGGAGAASGCH